MAKRNKRKISVPLIIVAAVVLLITIPAIVKSTKKGGAEVTVVKPSFRDITESIPASGKIQPVVEVKISPDVSGEIIELNFKEGDKVKRGDVVLKIKQETYISLVERAEASLNSVRAQYHQSKAQMTRAELSYKRSSTLHDSSVISDADFETAASEYAVALEQLKAAEFNVKSGEASLKEAREDLLKTTVTAPMSGIISRLSVEKGERVVGTSQMAGTEMFRIADFSRMEVMVDVNENDIVRIAAGDTASIEVDAYPNRKFTGVVTEIANSAKNIGVSTGQVTNFEVKVMILPESYADLAVGDATPFRPGMSSSVEIETAVHRGAMTLPIQCVTVREDTERVFVFDGKSTVGVKNVVTGIQDLQSIEITSGVDSGSLVVSGPYSVLSKTLKDGDRVTLKKDNK